MPGPAVLTPDVLAESIREQMIGIGGSPNLGTLRLLMWFNNGYANANELLDAILIGAALGSNGMYYEAEFDRVGNNSTLSQFTVVKDGPIIKDGPR